MRRWIVVSTTLGALIPVLVFLSDLFGSSGELGQLAVLAVCPSYILGLATAGCRGDFSCYLPTVASIALINAALYGGSALIVSLLKRSHRSVAWYVVPLAALDALWITWLAT